MIEERKHLGSGGEVTAANFNAEYWDRRYTPRAAMVPNFIRMSQGLELKILTTGKYLNVIREVNMILPLQCTCFFNSHTYFLLFVTYLFPRYFLPSFLPSLVWSQLSRPVCGTQRHLLLLLCTRTRTRR